MLFRRAHNRDSLFLTSAIFAGILAAVALSRIVFMVKRAMLGLSRTTRPSEPQIPV